MKIKNKGKVFPSPSSSPSSSTSSTASFSSPERDFLSVLNLLPAAIIALASVLSLEDREVLAYLITKSMKTTTDSFSFTDDSKKRSSKRSYISTGSTGAGNHKPPLFDCDCFDCYTSFWFRWDSSPNRELIHQAIEAFEDHLANGEQSKKSNRSKRRDKMGRRTPVKPMDISGQLNASISETSSPEIEELQDNDVSPLMSPEISEEVKSEVGHEWVALVVGNIAANNHKGLARKVLPDVLGLFNSRLWNLWSPNA